jgi:hypothetical protein
VLAQEHRLSLVAKVIGGLADGSELVMGTLGKGIVYELEPGAYEVGFDKGVASFLYAEPTPCVFTQHARLDGRATSDARFDFNVITAIEVEDQGDWEGLRAAMVELQGPDNAVEVREGETWVTAPGSAFLVSSIAAGDISAAAGALRALCPGV